MNRSIPMEHSLFLKGRLALRSTPVSVSRKKQKLEAAKMLEIIKTTSVAQQSKLVLMRSPAPFLIKVPDTNTVRAIHGLAPFLGDPLAPPSSLEGTLLAFDGNIEDSAELSRVIKLPANLITPEKVIVPT